MTTPSNNDILQEILKLEIPEELEPLEEECDIEYYQRLKDEYSETDFRVYIVDMIAQSIVMHDADKVENMLHYCFNTFDVRSSDDCFASNDRSLMEIAVRSDDYECVELLFANYTNASEISCDTVLSDFMQIQPLHLAIQLGHNNIAMYLYECESYLTFPGDVSSTVAISTALHYKNNELAHNFAVLFVHFHDDVVKILNEVD